MKANPSIKPKLPAFLIEDFLSIARVLIAAAWVGIAAALLVQVWVRLSPGLAWPQFGDFPLVYNLLLAEFTLTASLLTMLVVRRDWIERVPREAQTRIRQLTYTIVVWGTMHYLAGFHVTGSFGGPLVAFLPLLVCAAFVFLPSRGAAATSVVIVLGHLGVLLLEQQALILPKGLLAPAFSMADGGQPLAWIALLAITSLALCTGWLVRARLDEAGAAVHRPNRVDLHTGLFTREFLQTRVRSELARARQHGGSSLLLVIEIKGFADHTHQRGYDSSRELLQRAAAALAALVRPYVDTPARYSATTLACLIPTAGHDAAAGIADRILSSLRDSAVRADDAVEMVCGAALARDGKPAAAQLLDDALAAVARAAASDSRFELIDREGDGARSAG